MSKNIYQTLTAKKLRAICSASQNVLTAKKQGYYDPLLPKTIMHFFTTDDACIVQIKLFTWLQLIECKTPCFNAQLNFQYCCEIFITYILAPLHITP